MLRPLVKCHGGKRYLYKWVIDHFPAGYEKMTYVEPYIGGGSVLLNKKPSQREVISDIDAGLIEIWKAVKQDMVGFVDELLNIPYSEQSFSHASLDWYVQKPYPRHVNEYVLRRMSRGGLCKSFSKSNRQRGGKMGDENAWHTMLMKGLPAIYSRIKNVEIWNWKAVDMIQAYDSSNTLFYLDPPYLDETRVSKKAYKHEMTKKDHEELLDLIVTLRGKVLISGYQSILYSKILHGWNCATKMLKNHASQRLTKPNAVEALWYNF